MESAAMRTNYPETSRYLRAQRARDPREDAIEDYTEWTVMGQPINPPPSVVNPKPGQEGPPKKPATLKEPEEESEEEYVSRRCEAYMHKNLSSRRGLGGKFFTIGGGGDGGVAYQVL